MKKYNVLRERARVAASETKRCCCGEKGEGKTGRIGKIMWVVLNNSYT
jgi:hypothetical protein